MRCDEFEERLNAALDERRRPELDAELALHGDSCESCRQLAASYELLLDGFYEFATPEVPPDMAIRVVNSLRAEPSRLRRVSTVTAALAIAAGLLIAVIPLIRGTASNDERSAEVAATNKPVAPLRAPAAARSSHFNKLVASDLLSIPSSTDLAKGTGQNLATVMLFVPGIGGSKGIIDGDINDEPSWAEQMSEGLKPVSDSVAETLNLLLDSLPVTQLATKS
jgi:hypothetical protein